MKTNPRYLLGNLYQTIPIKSMVTKDGSVTPF